MIKDAAKHMIAKNSLLIFTIELLICIYIANIGCTRQIDAAIAEKYSKLTAENKTDGIDDTTHVEIDKHFARIFPSMNEGSLKKITLLQMKLDKANVKFDIRNALYESNYSTKLNVFRNAKEFNYSINGDTITLIFAMHNGSIILSYSGIKGLEHI